YSIPYPENDRSTNSARSSVFLHGREPYPAWSRAHRSNAQGRPLSHAMTTVPCCRYLLSLLAAFLATVDGLNFPGGEPHAHPCCNCHQVGRDRRHPLALTHGGRGSEGFGRNGQ